MTVQPISTPLPGDTARAPMVRAMFDRIAPRYDLANRVLSLGMDQWWRRQAIRALADSGQGDVLDLCAGTLDLTQMLLERGARHVTAADFSQAMLDHGRAKLPQGAPVNCLTADARDLPLEDNCVDGIICGFGLRNVPDLEVAIGECVRVLRPGGHMVVLDFFQPERLLSRLLQGSYNQFVVPIVGGLITGHGEAYRYLSGSIEAFCTRTTFEEMLRDQGLEVQGRDMLPPVAGLVTGRRTGGDG